MMLSSVYFSRIYYRSERNPNAGAETLFILMNAVLHEYGPKMGKALFKNTFEKIFKFRIFKHLYFLK